MTPHWNIAVIIALVTIGMLMLDGWIRIQHDVAVIGERQQVVLKRLDKIERALKMDGYMGGPP